MTRTRVAVMAAVLLIGAGPPPRERVVTGDGVVAGEVDGVPARIRIDPGALAFPIIGADLAGRAGLHTGSPLLGKHWGLEVAIHVGPTLILAHTAVGRIALGAAPFSRRIAWNERRYQPDVDGAVGPGGMPEPVVRFQLRAPLAGERTATLPLVDDGGLFGNWGASYAGVTVGTVPLRIRFAPRTARSYLGAGPAVRVAAALGGRFDGATVEEPIMFGIARPVRPMALARPLAVGPLSLIRVGVRTAEGGSTASIPESNAASPPDPDEVVVTASTKRKPRPGTLTLGADALARCSSIVFDKPAKQVRLTGGAPSLPAPASAGALWWRWVLAPGLRRGRKMRSARRKGRGEPECWWRSPTPPRPPLPPARAARPAAPTSPRRARRGGAARHGSRARRCGLLPRRRSGRHGPPSTAGAR